MVIWAKTDAGRAEIQSRARVKERAQRNLLLVIDGRTADEVLLGQLAGISARDFIALQALGLIAPAEVVGAVGVEPPPAAALAPPSAMPGTAGPPDLADEPVPLDYGQFTAALTRLISKELGLRGFMLTLAVEKASSPQELLAVAERTIDQIRDRRGDASADAASRVLFGS